MTKDNVHPALEKKDTVVVNLRNLPAPIHRALKIEAMDEGVSLEQHIVRVLALAVLKHNAEAIERLATPKGKKP
jgi:plasmid stability protein